MDREKEYEKAINTFNNKKEAFKEIVNAFENKYFFLGAKK